MTERVKSGLTWRGLETGYGEASEAPSNERDGQQIGFTYETPRQSSTLHIQEHHANAPLLFTMLFLTLAGSAFSALRRS